MNFFQGVKHLQSYVQSRFKITSILGLLKQYFKGRSEQVHDNIVDRLVVGADFLPNVQNTWDGVDFRFEFLEDFGLPQQDRVLCIQDVPFALEGVI